MTNLIIHPGVGADITTGAEWYREIDPELAECYLEAVYHAIELARATPERYSKIYREYRRVLCKRFPYKVVFEIVEVAQAVHVIGVTHTSQHPDAWKERI